MADTKHVPTTDTRPRPDLITDRFLDVLREYGVVEVSLFGSVSRGTETAESDLDLYVQFEPKVTLFRQMDLEKELSEICGRRVDLVTNLDPAFEPYILPTLISIPL